MAVHAGLHHHRFITQMGMYLEPLLIATDSQSLLDACITLNPGKDKSVLVALAQLRETLVVYKVHQVFVAGQQNPANDLTKPTYAEEVREILTEVSETWLKRMEPEGTHKVNLTFCFSQPTR
jgi:hypothetical protein